MDNRNELANKAILNDSINERLEKATECYKEIKVKYDEKIKEHQLALERIKELEDELAINGSSSQEIKALNDRLDKAKNIFKEQKATIAELKEKIAKTEEDFSGKQNRLLQEFNKMSSLINDVKVILEVKPIEPLILND